MPFSTHPTHLRHHPPSQKQSCHLFCDPVITGCVTLFMSLLQDTGHTTSCLLVGQGNVLAFPVAIGLSFLDFRGLSCLLTQAAGHYRGLMTRKTLSPSLPRQPCRDPRRSDVRGGSRPGSQAWGASTGEQEIQHRPVCGQKLRHRPRAGRALGDHPCCRREVDVEAVCVLGFLLRCWQGAREGRPQQRGRLLPKNPRQRLRARR